ncbi:DUF3889 domain-containing protein [Effusibacillus pohliae]|uniref:DUF3889 domain-containing protein n=1 Tax=Effusibacillus pohliae TaxID=232270 RepID=UPI0012EA195D
MQAQPAYAKWGRLAMFETSKRYPGGPSRRSSCVGGPCPAGTVALLHKAELGHTAKSACFYPQNRL